MTTTYDRTATARHEAGHAVWEVLNGRLPLRIEIDWPEDRIFGRVTLDLRGEYCCTPQTAPGMIIGTLLGPLAEGLPGWPLAWPLDKATEGDARRLARLSNLLNLDEAGWDSLVRQAETVAESEPFRDLVRLLAFALERVETLEQEQIRFLLGPPACDRYGIPQSEGVPSAA